MKRFLLRFLILAFGKRIALTNDPVVGEATTTFALSSSSRSSRMVCQGIMCFALVVFSVSCKSVERVESMTSNVETLRMVDTIYQHDSIFIREIVRGDTVYLTRTEWRDRWRTQLVHDTVHHTEFVEKIIEKPPEKYVPKFYKGCAWALGAILGVLGVIVVLKLRK